MDYIIESKIKNNIEKSIARYVKNNSRLTYAIVKDDKTIINGDNDIYDIGSISKVFTSLLILDMNDNNMIDISETIDKYIDLPKGDYPRVSDLLSHRTGYHHLTPIRITFWPLLFYQYKNKNVYGDADDKKVKKEIIKRRHHKSTRYGYSDFSYAILAMIIKNVCNKPFNNVMNEYLNRIGLGNSCCIDEHVNRVSKKNWNWNNDNPYLAAGGIASNIKDMVKFIRREFDRAEKQEFAFQKNHNLTFFTTKKGTVFWHVGGVGYFRSALIINPKRKIGVIVMGNNIGKRGSNPYYIAKLLYTAIRRNKIKY